MNTTPGQRMFFFHILFLFKIPGSADIFHDPMSSTPLIKAYFRTVLIDYYLVFSVGK